MFLKKPIFWDKKKTSILSIVLYPFSIIVIGYTNLLKLKSTKRFKVPTLCVGNIYIGGTGKTPISIKIFEILKSKGFKPAFIKKYYPFLSDEIKILEQFGKVFKGKNRVLNMKRLEKDNFDIAIMDDGFQDYSVHKDFSIICFHENQLIGNGKVIPAGPLRESITSVKRANIIMINGQKNKKFEEYLLRFNQKLLFFYFKYKISIDYNLDNKHVVAFAGIGNPKNFFELLKKESINVLNQVEFPDHYKYNDTEISALIKQAKVNNSLLITTEKDYYRIEERFRSQIIYSKIKVEIDKEENFIEILKNINEKN